MSTYTHSKQFFSTIISAFVLASFASGCNSTQGLTSQITSAEAQASTPPTGVAVVAATSAQCSNGGSVIETFSDLNGNGVLDAGEKVLTQAIVCDGTNGTNGAQGNGAGIIVAQAASGACPAGGETLTTFIDTNNNGVLDSGETVTSISTLCNGTDGTNGNSAHLTVTAAATSQCATGGAVYTSYVDGQTPIVTAVCNGTNGTNGTNGAQVEMGALGPEVPNQSFSACHHDYMYFPGTSTASGWLVFRHQDNGADDQGIGSTGFEVWNVDISDFLLVSEVGSVTYCQAHWDPVAKLLSYTVVDADDGFQGDTGVVQF